MKQYILEPMEKYTPMHKNADDIFSKLHHHCFSVPPKSLSQTKIYAHHCEPKTVNYIKYNEFKYPTHLKETTLVKILQILVIFNNYTI